MKKSKVKYLFVEQPSLSKGEKIHSLVLASNNGIIYTAKWSKVCDDESLNSKLKELEDLNNKIDKKLNIKK